MPDDVVTSECPGFGKDFDEDDSDCQGCKEGYPEEYVACKVLFETKQDGLADDPAANEVARRLDKEVDAAEPDLSTPSCPSSFGTTSHFVDEEDVGLDKEVDAAESEMDDGLNDSEPVEQELDEEETGGPSGTHSGGPSGHEEDVPKFEHLAEPKAKSKKKEVVKKYRRIETFAKLIRQGESWLPSELANAVDQDADKTYKPGVTTVVVTQWLKLLLLVGIAEKLDGGLYRLKAEFVGKIDE